MRALVLPLLVLAAGLTVPAGPAAAVPHAPVTASGYGWPLAGTPHVTRPFQPPPQPWLPGHRGVDLGATPAAEVRAAGAGVVSFAGQVAGVGVVSVDHPGGLRTTYEPVTPRVRAGQQVTRGQVIGALLAGHPGCPLPACLHWGLRRGATYLDPLALLGYARVRLLPLAAPPVPAPVFFLILTGGAAFGRTVYRDLRSVGSAAASRSYSSGRL